MAQRKFQLSEQEQAKLRRAYESTRKADERRRLQAVRLYGEGRPVSEIQSITGCSERSLMRWSSGYERAGILALTDKRAGGNRAKLTKAQRAEVRQKVNGYRPDQVLPPEVRASRGVFWTVSDLKLAVERWYGVEYQSPTSYVTLMHECRFSQQQVESQYRSRPSEWEIADFEAELEKK